MACKDSSARVNNIKLGDKAGSKQDGETENGTIEKNEWKWYHDFRIIEKQISLHYDNIIFFDTIFVLIPCISHNLKEIWTNISKIRELNGSTSQLEGRGRNIENRQRQLQVIYIRKNVKQL